MREANLDLLVEASGFTKKKMAEFDELTEEQVRVKEELGGSDSDDETDVCIHYRACSHWGVVDSHSLDYLGVVYVFPLSSFGCCFTLEREML